MLGRIEVRYKLIKEKNWNYVDMPSTWRLFNTFTLLSDEMEVEFFEGEDNSTEFVYIYLKNLFTELYKKGVVESVRVKKF